MRVSDELREHLLAWLRANSINPNNIPPDAYMSIAGDQLTTEEHMLGPDGQKLFTPSGEVLARTTATYTVTAPPADVAEWLRPRCSECGR
ncbi:MAG TPA: hypothetical protein VNC22_06505 [Sporichthya sp.]|nr:hypothetical protein [Sporichthya sp.]